MFKNINAFARPALAALALSIIAVSAPVMAEGPKEGLIFDQHEDYDYECQTIKQAARTLKKRGYKQIEYSAKESSEEVYYFYAKKKNQQYVWVPYYITYDPCDREIIKREPVKEEKKEEETM